MSVNISAQLAENNIKWLRGNWKHFRCFIWDREHELKDAENWTIFYTKTRDCGLLDEANHEAMLEILKSYIEEGEDILLEEHRHWAYGYIDGFSIRVFKDNVPGNFTEAFLQYCHIKAQLEDYPVLDEELYSQLECDATFASVIEVCREVIEEFQENPETEDWIGEVYKILRDDYQDELESMDDQGGYPTQKAIREALIKLGFTPLDSNSK